MLTFIWPFFMLAAIILMLCLKRSRIRYVFAAILLLLGFYTRHLSQHGITFSRTTCPNGKYRAWVNHSGLAMFSIYIDRGNDKETVFSQSGVETPPIERLFWIDDNFLGVDRGSAPSYRGVVDFVIDTNMYFTLTEDRERELAMLARDHSKNAMELYIQKQTEFNSNRPWERAPPRIRTQVFQQ